MEILDASRVVEMRDLSVSFEQMLAGVRRRMEKEGGELIKYEED